MEILILLVLYTKTVLYNILVTYPTSSGAANYIIYPPPIPDSSDNLTSTSTTYQVGINTGTGGGSLPQATLMFVILLFTVRYL